MEYKRGIPAYKDADGNTFGLLAETKEECITDDTGEKLSDKLVKIQDGMYTIPEGEKIHFKRGDGNADFTLNVGEKGIKANTALESTSWVGQVLEFINKCKVMQDESGIKIVDANSKTIATFKVDRIDFNNNLLATQIALKNGGNLYFDNPNNSDRFKIYCDENNDLVLQRNSSGVWTDICIIDTNGYAEFRFPELVMNSNVFYPNGKSLNFMDANNNYSKFRTILSTPHILVARVRAESSSVWIDAVYLNDAGTVTFTKPIVAPNIATTTALMETQQEITDMDLQNISTQQQLTEQDIINTEIQQKLDNINKTISQGGQTE